MDSDSEETVSNVSDLDQLRKGFGQSDWLILCPIRGLFFCSNQNPYETISSPIMASVSVSGQNKDKNDLLVIKQIGKFWEFQSTLISHPYNNQNYLEEQAEKIQKSYEETTNLLRGLLGTISPLAIMSAP